MKLYKLVDTKNKVVPRWDLYLLTETGWIYVTSQIKVDIEHLIVLKDAVRLDGQDNGSIYYVK